MLVLVLIGEIVKKFRKEKTVITKMELKLDSETMQTAMTLFVESVMPNQKLLVTSVKEDPVKKGNFVITVQGEKVPVEPPKPITNDTPNEQKGEVAK